MKLRSERGEQVKIIDDRVRRCERADEIFFTKGVDAVFDPDAGIGFAGFLLNPNRPSGPPRKNTRHSEPLRAIPPTGIP